MKQLAEFIMRGRPQAMAVASLATFSLFLAWVGAAAVALLLLRSGLNATLGAILAALLPAALWASAGDIGPLTGLFVVVCLAVVLRYSGQWSTLLLASPLVMGVWVATVLHLAPEYVLQLQSLAEQLFANIKPQLIAAASSVVERERIAAIAAPSGQQLLGLFAVLQLLMALLSLLVARWWQAALYNPGGFQQEFHSLRLTRGQMLTLLAGLLLLSQSDGYALWSWLFVVPVVIAGLALVHGMAARLALSWQGLLVFYLFLVGVSAALPLLMMMAIIDSGLDFRARHDGRLSPPQ